MRVLITGSRAPVALELIRAFGRMGHTVYAADSIALTLGSCSRYRAGPVHLPAPRYNRRPFHQALREAVDRLQIDLLIPTCEEVLYVAMDHTALSARTRLFCEPLSTLAQWHHKGTFQQHAATLGVRTPRTVLLRSQDDLRAALPDFPRYLLKPTYSRFATKIITNCGPSGAARSLDMCQPTPHQPWLLQEFIDGEAVCSYSIMHGGRITAHCAYVTPATIGHGSGTAFVSVDGGSTLEIVQTLVKSGFTGQLSFDFIRSQSGELYLLECNPRATSAVHLIRSDRLVSALLDPTQPLWIEPPAQRRQVTLAVVPSAFGQVLRQPLRWPVWHALAESLSTKDVIMSLADPLPALAQLPQVVRFGLISHRKGIGIIEATTDDIEWNGDADLHTRYP